MMDMGPVFVKLDEYKEVLDIVDVIRLKIDKAKKAAVQLQHIKQEEDREIKKWLRNLDDATFKIGEVKKALFEPKR